MPGNAAINQGTTMKDFNYALMLLKANKLEGAKDLLEELLQSDPGNQDILYNLGMCYTELDEPEKAVETLSECIRYYPHYANAHVALGFAYTRLADDEKARDHFLKALEIDPSNPYALRINPDDQQTAYGLGYSYFHIGQIDEADKYFQAAISLDESTSIAGIAKDFRREIAQISLKGKGFRPDAMFYCLSALQFFKDKSLDQVRQVAFEIGMKGREGMDINHPDKKYTLDTMDGSFTGLQLVSYMYVGFKMIDPKKDIGLDLSEEYKQALGLFGKERPHGYTIH
jgi:tetratricopeptide (TPR) repeat protein